MPSYMVCSQLLIKWKMGGAQNSLPCPSLTCVPIMTMNRMTKKAALGGPSSEDAFPLWEKTDVHVRASNHRSHSTSELGA